MASIPDDSFNCGNAMPCEFTDYSIEGIIGFTGENVWGW